MATAAVPWRASGDDDETAVEWSWTPTRALVLEARRRRSSSRAVAEATRGEAENAAKKETKDPGFVGVQALKRSKLRLKQRLLVLHENLDALLLVDPDGNTKRMPLRNIVRLDAEEDSSRMLHLRRLFGPAEYAFALEITSICLDDERRVSTSSRSYLFRSMEDRTRFVQSVRALLMHGSLAPPLPPLTERALAPRELLSKEEWTAEFDHVTYVSRDVRGGDLRALVHGLLRVSNYQVCFAMYTWPLTRDLADSSSFVQIAGNRAMLDDAAVCARVEVPLASIHEVRLDGFRLYLATNEMRSLAFGCDMNAAQISGLRDLILERKAAVRDSFTRVQGIRGTPWEEWACWNPRTELDALNRALDEAAACQGTPEHERLRLRLHDQTASFGTCNSYPRLLAVPQSTSEEDVVKVARFRSRGRIPVVRWVHPRTGGVLSRSSQPMVGITNHRCDADERLVNTLAQASAGGRLFIVDARGRPAVLGNTLQGRGLERASSYQGAIIQLCQIGNIHTMRGALTDLASAFEASHDASFWERVQSSHWLGHLAGIMTASDYVARRLHNGEGSVLVHCSDGFDRTPQLVCMARLILDPVSRTLEGFCNLVAAEWCAFGHKFAQRSSSRSSHEFSPIFVQFLDAVHNLLRHSPCAFEFNETLLVFLAEHTYSGRFGTFLHDSDLERIQDDAAHRTASIWREILRDDASRARFANTSFRSFEGPVWPPRGTMKLVPFFSFFDAEQRHWNSRVVAGRHDDDEGASKQTHERDS